MLSLKITKVVILSVVLSLLASLNAQASDYSDRPEVKAFIDSMVSKHKFDRGKLEKLFAAAERKDSILDAISRPAEKTKPWHEYRDIFITDSRIEKGVAFWKQHASTLDRASRTFGVNPEIIVAIIGVETRYGGNMGSYRVLDALSTLAFDYPKRSRFFMGQLEEFLLLAREQDLDPTSLKGSYAGAMGYGQFIPSSYRNYAVDFDGDGHVDIWNNPVDAIGSVANYFKLHGWQPGGEIAGRASVSANADPEVITNEASKPSLTVAELLAKGYSSDDRFDATAKASVMSLEGLEGPEFWMGLQNFYVITRYNHSHLYAMAVYQLSRGVAQRVL